MFNVCCGCEGMIDAFLSGMLDEYEPDPIEVKDFIPVLRSVLINVFGFCGVHADEVCIRLKLHVEKKSREAQAVLPKEMPS